MKKIFASIFALFIFVALPAQAATAKPTAWKAVAPDGYSLITWAKAPGIVSFFRAPSGNGAMDFITRIYLPQNQIGFIASTSSAPTDWGVANPLVTPDTAVTSPIDTSSNEVFYSDSVVNTVPAAVSVATDTYHNFAFARFVAEAAKAVAPSAQFIWNGPFFNVTNALTDLSLALKTSVGTSTLISSGSRPARDMAARRRMLLVNNATGRATIADFDGATFVSSTLGDVGIEGFAPSVYKTDGAGGTARMFLGVAPSGKELVIYCSQAASVNEASDALVAAGVPVENQLEADGGGSASCGYNLPGQYFVEPARTLPLLMGATTLLGRGTATTEGANVRSGMGAKFPIVKKLQKGESVRILMEKNGWYQIAEGQWVNKTLIKKI